MKTLLTLHPQHPDNPPFVPPLLQSKHVSPRIALYEIILPEIMYGDGGKTMNLKDIRHICIADSLFNAYRQAVRAFSAQRVLSMPDIDDCSITILGDV